MKLNLDQLTTCWPRIPLDNLVDFLDSKRKPIKSSERTPGPYPYYGANGLQDYVEGYLFDEKLVLLAEDGGFFFDPVRPITYLVEGKCWVNNHAHVLRAREQVIPEFLNYQLGFANVKPYLSGSTRAKLTKGDASRIGVICPPLPEQRRIVDLLSRAEGIVRLRREAEKKAAELIPALFLNMFGDPATNPKGWAEKPLEEVSEISYGIADKLDSTLTAADGYRILTISNVLQEGRIDPTVERYCKATEAQIKKSLVKRGDLLFNWRNGSETHIGKTAIWEQDDSVLHVSFLLRIRSVVAATNPYFLWAMLNLLRQQGFFIGVSRQQINRKFNASELSALVLPTPPIAKQKLFAEKMELIRGIQSQQSIASFKAQATFDALLAQAFSA